MPKCYVMLGLPGSGKTTWAKAAMDLTLDGVDRNGECWAVYSADHYFMQDGSYKFDPTKLNEAHASCLRNFTGQAVLGLHNLVVDNTNLTMAQLAPYVALAQAYGYDTEIVIVECDPQVAAARNVHGVPADKYEYLVRNMEQIRRNIPRYWKTRVVQGA